MNPNPVTASRIKQLRKERGESQGQFAEKLSTLMDKSQPISVMTVSCWESGRKQPPFATMLWLQKYFGCSLDYLAGLSDVRTIDGVKAVDNLSDIRKGIEISELDLQSKDGEPVYVVFPSTYQNQWGIVDYSNKAIVFTDFTLAINSKCKYFTYVVPEEITIRSLAHHLLNLGDMMTKERVWIESLSPDPFIRGRVTGWYKHSPDKEFLINDLGYTLSYDGLGITYNAKEFKSTREKK